MIKYFCDGCGEELFHSGDLVKDKTFTVEPSAMNPHSFPIRRITVQTIVAVDLGWNQGHVCISCVRLAVEKGAFTTDRPLAGSGGGQ